MAEGTYYTDGSGKKIKVDGATGFINYVGKSDDWIAQQVAKRTANELVGITPIITIKDKDGNYDEKGTMRINLINKTSFYSEYNNTSLDQVIWNAEHRISPEAQIGFLMQKHEEEFTGKTLPLISLARNIILETRENNKSLFAYFITSRKKVQNAYLFTVAISMIGYIYIFDYQTTQSTLALTPDEVDKIVKTRNRKNRATKANIPNDIIEIKLNNKRFAYHEIMFNLPNGMADMDYVRPTQLTDMLDEISWAMLWEIQANQTKVVLLTAVASANSVQEKSLAQKKLKEWKSQIQINIETSNTTDQQSITVHNPQLQNTLPVYMKTYKEVMNLIYQLSGNAKDHESNDKGTAQQSVAEIKGMGGSQYETIQIKKKLRQHQYERLFKRIVEFDIQELGNSSEYPDDYTICVDIVTTSESDKSEKLTLLEREDELGLKTKTQQLMEYNRQIQTKKQAENLLQEIMEQKDKYNPQPEIEEEAKDDKEKVKDPNDPKNKKQ